MTVSVSVGILIIAVVWSMPVGIAYLVYRFIKWQESKKILAFVPGNKELAEIMKGKTLKQVSLDGSRELTLGYEKEGF